MPTTSNFGWTTPADTDLVKDGAAAIRTLGNGVDASLVDLKGGTTGQVLSKATNTDLDYTWITPNVGDITEVQAGTGISVASGTGPIPVVTNTVATAIDAKGDLIVGTGADTFARLAVGTNGHTLVAKSSEATGLAWEAPSTPTFLGCRVTKSANQALVTATNTAITWDVEDYDTNTMHDNVTNNSRITIPSGQGGYYLVQANLVYNDPNSSYSIAIYKNGAAVKRNYSGTTNANDQDIEITAVLNLAAADYIEIFGRQNSGGNKNVMSNANDPQNSAFQVVKLG
jgi:hypothetical protein